MCFLFLVNASLSFAETQVVLPAKIYATGVYDIASIELPAATRYITVSAKRMLWEDLGRDVISVQFEISSDGGRSWSFLFGFTTAGGEIKDSKTGLVKEKSAVRFDLGKESNGSLMIRGNAEMFTSLKTEIKVELE